jgi:pyruvate dehydrogenase E2 component (dihydrolipoamide acetyltransferase)
MRYEFKLPDLAEGMVEGELVGWLVAAGDVVKAEQPIAEVMTDKATVVIPSPVAGKAVELPWQAGDIVKVGQVLMVFEADGAAPTQRSHAGHVMPTDERPAEVKAPVAVLPVEASSASVAPATTTSVTTVSQPSAPATPRGSRALAAPATRRLARELGLDIAEVTGTGPGGRVLPEDVTRHAGALSAVQAKPAAPVERVAQAPVAKPASKPSWAPAPRAAADGGEERQKLRGLRRAIYETMARSTSTAAHFTYVDEVDCEALVAAREKLGAAVKDKVKLTYLPFIAKAVLLTLPRFPKMNATVDDQNQEVVLKKYVHLGIAAATEPGLVVPVIRNADKLSILELAWYIQDLGERAKNNKLRPDELKGSTFTITSLGKLGGLFATPIINHPEVGILGIHQMNKRAVVVDDLIVARQRMNLSLSFDHRLIDGHEGAAFAQEIKRYLETPELMMLEMV